MLTAFLVVLALWLGYRVGWENAHITVARECRLLGKFFVKNKIYHVEKIEEFYSEK